MSLILIVNIMCIVGHIVRCISCMSYTQKYYKDNCSFLKILFLPKLGYLWSSEILCKSHKRKHLQNTYSYGRQGRGGPPSQKP